MSHDRTFVQPAHAIFYNDSVAFTKYHKSNVRETEGERKRKREREKKKIKIEIIQSLRNGGIKRRGNKDSVRPERHDISLSLDKLSSLKNKHDLVKKKKRKKKKRRKRLGIEMIIRSKV